MMSESIQDLQRRHDELCKVASDAFRQFGGGSREFDEAATNAAAIIKQLKELRRDTRPPQPAKEPARPKEPDVPNSHPEKILANRISNYWSERGRAVEVRVIVVNGAPCVRSNMIGGAPRSAQ